MNDNVCYNIEKHGFIYEGIKILYFAMLKYLIF